MLLSEKIGAGLFTIAVGLMFVEHMKWFSSYPLWLLIALLQLVGIVAFISKRSRD